MNLIQGVPWQEMFLPDTPVVEILVRGTVTYLGLFAMLRVLLKRQAGTTAVTDLLLLVLIADAAQNAMSGGYKSIPDGLLLVATLIFWAFALDWLAYRFRVVARFVHPPPLLLVKDGQMLRRNMRRELITVDELMTHLREQGIRDVTQVKCAYMEGDGRISAIGKESHPDDADAPV